MKRLIPLLILLPIFLSLSGCITDGLFCTNTVAKICPPLTEWSPEQEYAQGTAFENLAKTDPNNPLVGVGLEWSSTRAWTRGCLGRPEKITP